MGDIQGMGVARGGRRISHLFFANDSILFYQATCEEWSRIKALLSIYENGLGQALKSKSPRYSLVSIPALMFKMQFYVSLVVELVMIMTATLAFQLMSGNPSTIAFVELKKRSGNGSTIDKVNCFPKQVARFSSMPSSKPSHILQSVCTGFPRNCALSWLL